MAALQLWQQLVAPDIPFEIKYTADDGPRFARRQAVITGLPIDSIQCYPFRGAPDITIKRRVAIIDTGEDTASV